MRGHTNIENTRTLDAIIGHVLWMAEWECSRGI